MLELALDQLHINFNRETVALLLDFQNAMLPSAPLQPVTTDWTTDGTAMATSIFVPPTTGTQRHKVCLRNFCVRLILPFPSLLPPPPSASDLAENWLHSYHAGP